MGTEMIKKHFIFTEEEIKDGKYNAWDIIQPLWYSVSIYDGVDVYNNDLKPFSNGQRRIFALNWYISEVINGGHDQFFFNSTGIVWKDALEAMKMIGAGKMADNLQKAVDLFGGDIPFDREKRAEMLDKLCEKDDFDDFEQIDSTYYDDEDMDELMDMYVKNHPSEFVLDGEFDYVEF